VRSYEDVSSMSRPIACPQGGRQGRTRKNLRCFLVPGERITGGERPGVIWLASPVRKNGLNEGRSTGAQRKAYKSCADEVVLFYFLGAFPKNSLR